MRARLTLLLLACLLLAGCKADPIASMATPVNTAIPAPVVENLPAATDAALLWFRYGEEDMLASEARALTVSRTESLAEPLLRTLLEGPSAASPELRGLFPQGTRLISVSQGDGVIFVTLSHHLLNAYPDEPQNWRDDPYWAVEAPLRRKLAMQSIAATLTENCGADTVIILVADEQTASDSLRLKESYYLLSDSNTAAAPLKRDENLLLTPTRTAEIILQCWQEADWSRLYQYIARIDPDTGVQRPTEEEYRQRVSALPRLISYDVAGGSVNGTQAVFTFSGVCLAEGTEQVLTGQILRLTYERGMWRIGLSQLLEGGMP